MEFIHRFFQAPEQSFFLFGPRGTGKSSWLQHTLADPLRIDLLKPNIFRSYVSRPERLEELLAAHPEKQTIVIDEVQKVPSLLEVVHSLMEEKTEAKQHRIFILTGSSARKLKRSGIDLLAGRALLRTLHPFMAKELGEKFSLEKALHYGLLPVVVASTKPLEVLKAYHGLYLKEEVQMEALVRNIGDFSRFLEVISFSHAAQLNLSNIARECEVGRKTVEGYLDILEDLLLSFRIPVFTKRAKRALAAHPKFYLFDTGVFRTLRPEGILDQPTEIEGAALEGLVVQHLRAWNAYRGEPNKLYYWRTRSGVEVDIVLYGKDGLWAFEIKNTTKVRPDDLHALQTFKEDYPECVPIFLYRGTEKRKIGEILCLPCDTFLRELHPEKPI